MHVMETRVEITLLPLTYLLYMGSIITSLVRLLYKRLHLIKKSEEQLFFLHLHSKKTVPSFGASLVKPFSEKTFGRASPKKPRNL
jgi:hypothetical protein